MPLDIVELDLYRHPLLLARLRRLRGRIHAPAGRLSLSVATSPEPVPFAERGRLTPRPAGPGTLWGTAFTCAWFHVTGRVPARPAGEHVAVVLDLDGEALVLDASGAVRGAVSSRTTPVEQVGAVRGKTRLAVTPELAPGGVLDLWLDAGFNGKLMPPFGVARVRRAQLVTVRDDVEALYYDALACAYASIASSPRAGDHAAALAEAFALVERDAGPAAVAAARGVLAPLLAGEPDPALALTAVGHAHLDLAWLWPLRETRRKAARTFTLQLAHLDARPGYVFGASQPQQFAWLEESDPELFGRVRNAVASGRLEPQGGLWVETDANLPSGESLVRQALYGQRYWQSRFGQTARICWLPDVFGYNGNLPQLLVKAGMDRFLTIKLSWNEHNDFGHRSFVWRGIDGSEVLVHMPPEGSYNSSASALALAAARDRLPEREAAPEALLVYGSGDGGGGPGPAHLALVERSAALAGLPAVTPGTAASFFDRLDTHRERLPVHTGELYLEKHQGTYTTQGRTKRANRLAEHRLHDVEYLAALAHAAGRDWPRDLLAECWCDVLLFQFHDIIPGSSIGRVYAEAEARYAEIDAALLAAQDALLTGGGGVPVFVNTTPVPRQGHVRRGGEWLTYSARPFETVPLLPWRGAAPAASGDVLDNGELRATFAADGTVSSLVDLATGREHAAGPLNRLVLHRDPWSYFDAWDIAADYAERRAAALVPDEVETFTDGPRLVRRQRYRHGRSTIEQDTVLTPGQPYLLFETRVDWHERWRMLRAEFRPAAWADEVACEIQYGHLFRSTRDDTPAERAQFEICAHRWVDLSDAAGGLALLNDAKYGHRVKAGLVSLNLLRSPVYPDPRADRGRHAFRYALAPHAGPLAASDVPALAAHLNAPEVVTTGTPAPPAFEVAGQGVWLDVVKPAEDGPEVILRLHEWRGAGARVGVRTPWPEGAVVECDLLERPLGGAVSLGDLAFGPFEIRSFRLTPR